MFRVDVNVNGEIKSKMFSNKLDDDFIKYLPKYFSDLYDEDIERKDIDVYAYDGNISRNRFMKRLNKDRHNRVDFSKNGEMSIVRYSKKKYDKDQIVPLEEFEKAKENRLKKAEGAKEPAVITDLPSFKHTFDAEEGEVDAVQIPEGHELTTPFKSVEHNFKLRKVMGDMAVERKKKNK
jgi:hypothetical protein